jgi:rare lipoprotein A
MAMAEPRKALFLFAVLLAATAIAAVEQTSASLFPHSLSFPTLNFGQLDDDASDALGRALARAEEDERIESQELFEEIGRASWYGRWHHGRTTASGEKFDMNKLTAAHRTLPLRTNVRLTNLDNGRSVDVTINDRGPYVGTRVIDLSREAARELRMEREGLAAVLIETTRAEGVASARSGATD